jgi:hypothetical protein
MPIDWYSGLRFGVRSANDIVGAFIDTQPYETTVTDDLIALACSAPDEKTVWTCIRVLQDVVVPMSSNRRAS